MLFLEYVHMYCSSKKPGGEGYYSVMSFLAAASEHWIGHLESDEPLLLTPMYLGSGTYELYPYELNVLTRGDGENNEHVSFDEDMYFSSLGVNAITPSFVTVPGNEIPTDLFIVYFRFLLECQPIKDEIEGVFKVPFEQESLFFAVY